MAVKKKKNALIKKDAKKERIFRLLADAINSAGINVRREPLRRGHGWRASSGGCLLKNSNLILIDQALGQDEQIELLIGYANSLAVAFADDVLQQLPNGIRTQLLVMQQQAA